MTIVLIENFSLSLSELGSQIQGFLFEPKCLTTIKPYWIFLPLKILPDGKKSLFSDFKRSLFELYFGGGAFCFSGSSALTAATYDRISFSMID